MIGRLVFSHHVLLIGVVFVGTLLLVGVSHLHAEPGMRFQGEFLREGKRVGPPFTLEIAATHEARALGLMYRRSMGSEEGMLFLFPDVAERSFWMKNTYLSLDMLFLDAKLCIQEVLEKVPPLTLEQRTIPGLKSKAVLELLGGNTKRLGLAVGDCLYVKEELPAVK